MSTTCQHLNRQPFLKLPPTPLADSFPAEPHAEVPYYPLGLTVCPECFMIELDTKVDDTKLFGRDYGFFSGSSPALVRYFAEYARWVRESFPDQLGAVVEIAANDGTLLEHFAGTSITLGVDPAGPPTAAAREKGLDVRTEPFTAASAKQEAPGLPGFRLVIANNVIAHVPDLDDFIEGLALLVGDQGVGIVEFQYLPDLLLGNDFPLVYHEHRRFLSLSSLLPALHAHGLDVVDFVRTPTQGGSLRLVLKRIDVRAVGARVHLWNSEAWIRDLGVYTSFQGRVDHIQRSLCELIETEVNAGRRIGLFGAPAKATTLLHLCSCYAEHIEYAVDLTPEKIGKYMPGTDILIRHEAEAEANNQVDTYLLAIPNYLSMVVRKKQEFLANGGRFIVALPKPMVI